MTAEVTPLLGDESKSPAEAVWLAEYKALRDESLRCAQLLSNAVWTAVTGFGLTAGIGAAFVGKVSETRSRLILPGVVILLCIQAIAISTIYLSELWKYIRVGYYLRTRVEAHFVAANQGVEAPMYWEHWIENQRARWLYLASLTFLQFPIGLSVAAGGVALWSWKFYDSIDATRLGRLAALLFSSREVSLLIAALVVFDAALVCYLYLVLQDAQGGRFGTPPSPQSRSDGGSETSVYSTP